MLRIITSFAFMGAAIFFVIGVVLPKYQGVKMLQSEEAELKVALENSQMLQESWDDLLDRYNAVNPADLTRLELLMPSNVDNVKLLIELDSLAQSLGLQINSIDTEEVKDQEEGAPPVPGESGEVIMTLAMSGEYSSMVSFLDRVETSLRLMDIDSFDIAASVSELGTVEYQYNLVVRTYWLRNQSVAVQPQ